MIGVVTWQSFEFLDQVHVVAVGVGGHEVELLPELLVQRVALVHHPDHERLDVPPPSFGHGPVQLDRVPLIGLTVCDDDGHLPHAWPRPPEHLVGLLDGAAGEGALAHVGHRAHRRLDLVGGGHLLQADHHRVDVAVEDHADPRGVPANRGPVDQGVHEVLNHVEVVGADAL